MIQTILFVTMIPLAYVLWERWYGRQAGSWWVVLLLAANANLTYMMYHNFFGQVVFWGILLTTVTLVTEYFERPERKTELFVGAGIAAMYLAYHEPAVFVLVPLALTAIWKKRWEGLLRIAGVAALLAGISIINATIFDFGQAFKGNPEQPIGWQIFRPVSPTSNPWELTGMTSVHTDEPLPIYLAWGLSILIASTWAWGAYKSSGRHYVWIMMAFFAGMLWWTAMGDNGNWFVFNRATTYILPILIVVWAGGIIQLPKWVRYGVMVLVAGMIIKTGIRLNLKLVDAHLTVHSWYQTAGEVRNLELAGPIFNSGHLVSSVSIWDQNWTGYFLYPMVNKGTIPARAIRDQDLVLMNKSTPWVKYPSYILNDIQWENVYYQLGRICLGDECLINTGLKLDQITFGESAWEDNLLGSGWGNPEKEGRWTVLREAKLTLFSYPETHYGQLEMEVQTIVPEQQIQIVVDGVISEAYSVGTEWGKISVPVRILTPGKHEVVIKVEHLGSPSKILGNSDTRGLGVRLRSLRLF